MHQRALRGLLKTLREFPEVSELTIGGDEPVTVRLLPRQPAPKPRPAHEARPRSAVDSLRDPDPVFELPQ